MLEAGSFDDLRSLETFICIFMRHPHNPIIHPVMDQKDKLPPQVPKDPLQRIALCMSGGGYRAATFQLGMMSYLNSKQFESETLLQKVKAISTVSGGTIIGVYYAAMTQEGRTFEEIYSKFVAWITTTDLVKAALEKLSPNGHWRYPYKRKNIINAFAELYDDSLLDHQTMQVFNDMNKSHLEFVCFNATEFLKGYRFRFQAYSGRRFVGSNDLKLKKAEYEKLRLGDIMAASSGFSGGFEPISMPNDFFSPDSEEHHSVSKKIGDLGTIGLMDGGIHDNQGISSIETYQEYEKTTPFDLILFSDVSSPYLDAFKFHTEKKGAFRENTIASYFRKAKWVQWIGYLLNLLVIIAGVLVIHKSNYEPSTQFGVGLAIVAFGVLGAFIWLVITQVLKSKWKSLLTNIVNKMPEYFLKRLPSFDFKNMKIKTLETLLLDRYNSLKLLLPDIFLKQVRRLHYNRIFEDDNYYYRRSACLIKELTEIDYEKRDWKNTSTGEMGDYTFMREHNLGFKGNNQKEVIGEKMLEYTTHAASFGTTLWFSEKDDLDDKLKALIISGQVSCCQDLLIYLSRIIYTKNNGFNELDAGTKTSIIALHKSIMEDWERFKNTPEFLYQSLK